MDIGKQKQEVIKVEVRQNLGRYQVVNFGRVVQTFNTLQEAQSYAIRYEEAIRTGQGLSIKNSL